MGRFSKVTVVYLMMGSACNMTCKHCSQSGEYKDGANAYCPPLCDELVEFIENMSYKSDKARVYLWGGEPLVYWQTIKDTITMFENRGVDNLTYIIFTNGLLLNDEIIDFCNERCVELVMSYDAPDPKGLRNAVPSKYAIECFKRFKGYKRVNSVFTAYNPNLIEYNKSITELFPEEDIEKSLGFFMVLGEASKKVVHFKEHEVYDRVTEFLDTPRGQKWINGKARNIRTFDKEHWKDEFYPMCNHGNFVMAFDFNGNCYACHNGAGRIGHISDGEEVLREKYLKYWKDNMQEACETCEALDMCRCHCPAAVKEDNEYYLCKAYREMRNAIYDWLKAHDKL